MNILTHCCLFSVCLFFLSCEHDKKDFRTDESIYENGDIVFRLGDSSVSNAVMIADEYSDYSHVGIIAYDQGIPVVIHACPDDVNTININNSIKKDRINEFFSNGNALNGAIYRINDKKKAVQAANEALRMYNEGIKFDFNFDANDTTEMYCTELIEFVFGKSGVSLSDNKRHHVNMPGINIDDCIFISDLTSSDKLQIIDSF